MFMNTRTERGKKERDVLFSMLVTLFVSHFERSPLNAEASRNAIKRDIKRRVNKKGKSISINVFDVQNIY